MTIVRCRFNCFILAILLLMGIPISDCGADCFYSCTENPEDAIPYYLGRDGEYHPIPTPPPVMVYGPPVYYDHGYPVRVGSELPGYHHQDDYRSYRRERWRRELDEWHNEQVRKYHK